MKLLFTCIYLHFNGYESITLQRNITMKKKQTKTKPRYIQVNMSKLIWTYYLSRISCYRSFYITPWRQLHVYMHSVCQLTEKKAEKRVPRIKVICISHNLKPHWSLIVITNFLPLCFTAITPTIQTHFTNTSIINYKTLWAIIMEKMIGRPGRPKLPRTALLEVWTMFKVHLLFKRTDGVAMII